MSIKILTLLAAALLVAGCTETPEYRGAAVDTDQNVLTGGPITGTTIQDLPQAVKDTLKRRVPHDEIASIAKARQGKQVVYDISFLEANETPEMYVREDGKVMPDPMRAEK